MPTLAWTKLCREGSAKDRKGRFSKWIGKKVQFVLEKTEHGSHTAKQDEAEACAGQREGMRCWAKGEKGRLEYTAPQLSPWSILLPNSGPRAWGWLQDNVETGPYLSTQGHFLERILPATWTHPYHQTKLSSMPDPPSASDYCAIPIEITL